MPHRVPNAAAICARSTLKRCKLTAGLVGKVDGGLLSALLLLLPPPLSPAAAAQRTTCCAVLSTMPKASSRNVRLCKVEAQYKVDAVCDCARYHDILLRQLSMSASVDVCKLCPHLASKSLERRWDSLQANIVSCLPAPLLLPARSRTGLASEVCPICSSCLRGVAALDCSPTHSD